MPKNNQLYVLAALVFSIILCLSSNRGVYAEGVSGKSRKDQGSCEEAIKYFKEAIKVDPNSTGSYVGLGWLLHNYGGNDEEAIRCFKEAIKRSAKDSRSYAGLAWVYKDQGKYEEAIKYFKEAIRVNPKDRASRGGLDWVYIEQKNYQEARKGLNNDKK